MIPWLERLSLYSLRPKKRTNTPGKRTNVPETPENQWLEDVFPIERLSLFRGHEPFVFGGVTFGSLDFSLVTGCLESHANILILAARAVIG